MCVCVGGYAVRSCLGNRCSSFWTCTLEIMCECAVTVWIKYWQDKHGNYITVPRLQRELMLACCNGLPTAVLEGCYKIIPYELRLCPCGQGAIETTAHVLLYCTFYISEISFFNVKLLLSNQYVVVSLNVAKCCYTVYKISQALFTH